MCGCVYVCVCGAGSAKAFGERVRKFTSEAAELMTDCVIVVGDSLVSAKILADKLEIQLTFYGHESQVIKSSTENKQCLNVLKMVIE
jgi:hypothetical protein